jgi:hypothetical protein
MSTRIGFCKANLLVRVRQAYIIIVILLEEIRSSGSKLDETVFVFPLNACVLSSSNAQLEIPCIYRKLII